jgi:hypothetical protein
MARAGIGPIRDGGGASKKPPVVSQRSNQPRRPDNWHELVMRDRERRADAAAANAAAAAAAAAAANTRNQQAARDQAARDQAAAAAAAQAAAQAAAEQAAREAAAREAARREEERLEALKRAEAARIAAIVAARPTVPRYLASTSVSPVKYASPADVLIQESSLPIDLILKQTLEKIGGLELISLVRHDTVNGQDIAYQPVKNLSQIEALYNPQNMVKIPDSSELFFKNFVIKLDNHTIQDTNSTPAKTVDLDSEGRIIIDVVSLKPDYEVEIQTVSLGKVFDDTIYTEDE